MHRLLWALLLGPERERASEQYTSVLASQPRKGKYTGYRTRCDGLRYASSAHTRVQVTRVYVGRPDQSSSLNCVITLNIQGSPCLQLHSVTVAQWYLHFHSKTLALGFRFWALGEGGGMQSDVDHGSMRMRLESTVQPHTAYCIYSLIDSLCRLHVKSTFEQVRQESNSSIGQSSDSDRTINKAQRP